MTKEEYLLYLENQLNLHIKEYNDDVEKSKLNECTISNVTDLIFANRKLNDSLRKILEEYTYLNEVKVREFEPLEIKTKNTLLD